MANTERLGLRSTDRFYRETRLSVPSGFDFGLSAFSDAPVFIRQNHHIVSIENQSC